MSRSADIDRIFAHIGTPDMKYHEFEPAPDADQARSNWSLVNSATRDSETAEPPRPEAPEQRAEAYRERVADRTVRRVPPQEAPIAEATAPDRPLQQVFSRISGRPTATEPLPEPPAEPPSTTPLSQVFKRLT